MELMKKERLNGTIGKITPVPLDLVNLGLHNDPDYRSEMFIKNKQKLKIRLLCHEKLEEPLVDLEEDDDE